MSPFRDAYTRKYNYVNAFASVEGVFNASEKFIGRNDLDLGFLGFSFTLLFNLSVHLLFNYNIPIPLPLPVTVNGVTYTYLPYPANVSAVTKAYYGKSRYNYAYVDPAPTIEELARVFAHELRNHLTRKRFGAYRAEGAGAKAYVNWLKSVMIKYGLPEWLANYIAETYLKVEGKAISVAYWDLSAWNGCYWSERGEFAVRSVSDYKSVQKAKSAYYYEAHWNYDRRNYARWTGKEAPIDSTLSAIARELLNALRRGNTWIDGVFYPEVKWLRKVDDMHEYGGYAQIKSADGDRKVRAVLDKFGIAGVARTAYIAFAREVIYMRNARTRKVKKWKRYISVDDIVNKYERLGLNRRVLNAIRRALNV